MTENEFGEIALMYRRRNILRRLSERLNDYKEKTLLITEDELPYVRKDLLVLMKAHIQQINEKVTGL